MTSDYGFRSSHANSESESSHNGGEWRAAQPFEPEVVGKMDFYTSLDFHAREFD